MVNKGKADGERSTILADSVTGVTLQELEGRSHCTGAVKFDREGKQILGVSEGRAIMWDAASGKIVREFMQEKAASAVAMTPRGGIVVTAGSDLILRFWDRNRGVHLYEMQAHGFIPGVSIDGLEVSSDSRILLGWSRGNLEKRKHGAVKTWDITSLEGGVDELIATVRAILDPRAAAPRPVPDERASNDGEVTEDPEIARLRQLQESIKLEKYKMMLEPITGAERDAPHSDVSGEQDFNPRDKHDEGAHP